MPRKGKRCKKRGKRRPRRGPDPRTLFLARQGVPEAQFRLGTMYLAGDGVPYDAEESVKWMRAAAEQGDPGAQSSLADAYYEGAGVGLDLEQAARVVPRGRERWRRRRIGDARHDVRGL